MDIDALLQQVVENRASDLHLKVGRPPLLRLSGKLVPTAEDPISRERMQELLGATLTPAQKERLKTQHEIDYSYSSQAGRFRVNAFYQRGMPGAVFRLIPTQIPTVDDLGLPPVLKDLCLKPQGLILVTGPTGSGKSTTLAALIQQINRQRQCHIVTVEDPIEFLYEDDLATINQRQVGEDTPSFASALKNVLRQDPDVILIGEMRDPESMGVAINAAETGHLVFSTLHTNDATQTVDRIVDMFPAHQRQVRTQLSLALLGVISQRLLDRADGRGRVVAVEVMINSPTIQDLIAKGETSKIRKAIEESVSFYRMQSLNQAMVQLVEKGSVEEEEALRKTPYPDELKLMLKGARKQVAAGSVQYIDGDFI